MPGNANDAVVNAEILPALIGLSAPEEFGPYSDRPCLVIALDGTDPALGPALASLPCPVIGIGEGGLAPWCDVVLPDASGLPVIAANIRAAPIAAMVLVQHLRMSEALSIKHALTAESLAFAAVQTGPDFRNWQGRAIVMPPPPRANGPAVVVEREGAFLRLTLNRPSNNNAIDIEMRDALVEALRLAAIDDEVARVELRGEGRCFSVGGDIREFGSVSDPATAHWVRSLRLPARVVAGIGDRLEVRVQGAVVGAGLEIAAFARRIVATPDAWFQLPELKYGLIPGAGGTVSVPRRIGRQRAAYMALSMRRVSARAALDWGLIDEIAE